MDIYKLGNQLGLRFPTTKGLLSIEQLFTLNQTQLATVVKGCKKVLKGENDDELSFLDETTKINKEDQLRFDIVKDIYLTKKKSAEDLKEKADKKVFEQKILGLIAEKQEDSLRGKTIEELEALLKS
jgi:hypothetical protein